MDSSTNNDSAILALDVGAARIGVASATMPAKIACPLTYLPNHEGIVEDIVKLVKDHQATALVVGLPRGLDGQETAQTNAIQEFVAKLKPSLDVPIHMQDEALTSRQAEIELEARGKAYTKGDIDALAACYILTDFINEYKTW